LKAKNLLLPSLDAAQKRDVTYGEYVATEAGKDGLTDAPVSPPGYGDGILVTLPAIALVVGDPAGDDRGEPILHLA
jgi:hypothetical protein